jgi:NADH dehydrogenase FAD-containing subunit
MKRRQFIQTTSAVSAIGSLSLLSGCASIGGVNSPKVVVVGGGYGGATAAKYVRMWSDYGIEVTLIEPNASFVSCPISNLVIGGSKTMADITMSYENLVKRHGVKLIKDFVTQVDPDKRLVKLSNGSEVAYDRLILSPGVDFMLDALPGLNKPDAQQQFLHAWGEDQTIVGNF